MKNNDLLTLLTSAIQNQGFQAFWKDSNLFPLIIKGGFEDLMSFKLGILGFSKAVDFIPQFSVKANSRLDLAIFQEEKLSAFVAFGHQFSNQFKENAAIDKLVSEAKKRAIPELESVSMATVHIVTNIIEISPEIANQTWAKFYLNRYGIKSSIKEQSLALSNIENTYEALKAFTNLKIGMNAKNEHLKMAIDNIYGKAEIHFLITAGVDSHIRQSIKVH